MSVYCVVYTSSVVYNVLCFYVSVLCCDVCNVVSIVCLHSASPFSFVIFRFIFVLSSVVVLSSFGFLLFFIFILAFVLYVISLLCVV